MPENPPPEPKKRRAWKKWLKRIGLTLLVLLGLLIAFHRPIIFEGTRYFVVRAAKQQNLDISYDISGSIFSTLSVSNLRATPTEPGPVDRLEIGVVNLEYSLWALVRDGLPAFLHLVEAKDIFVELEPGEPEPPEKAEEPQEFKFPALIPAILNLENINVLIRAETGDTVIEGLHFSLLPDRPGVLRLAVLDIPGVRRWTDISAATTFRERNFVLSDLVIGQEIALRKFQFDMSSLEENALAVALDGVFFEAPLTLNARIEDLNASNHITASVELSEFVIERLWEYLNLEVPVTGRVEALTATFAGAPNIPADWNATAIVRLENLAAEEQRIGDIRIDAGVRESLASVEIFVIPDPENSIALRVEAALPDDWDDFIRTNARGTLEVNIPEPERLPLPEPIQGDLAVHVEFQTDAGKLTANARVTSESLSVAEASIRNTNFTLKLGKDLTLLAEEDRPIFESLETQLEGAIGAVEVAGFTLDTFRLALTTEEANVRLREIVIGAGENIARVSATYVVPGDFESWMDQPLAVEVDVRAPDLSAFVAEDADIDLSGTLGLTGQASSREGQITGAFVLNGSDIQFNELPVRTLEADIAIAEQSVRIPRLEVVLDDNNRITGNVEAEIGEIVNYAGALDVQLDDLSMFQPLLGDGPDAPELGGALSVLWSGRGSTEEFDHTGSANVHLINARFGDLENLAASFNASYAQDHINIPDWFVTSDFGTAMFSLFWSEDRLRVTHLAVRQRDTTLVEGELVVPLRLEAAGDLERMIPRDAPLSVDLRTRNLSVENVLREFGEDEPLITARVNLTVAARGTLATPEATVDFQASRVQSREAAQIDPADVSMQLNLADNRLAIDGSVRQRLIQPLSITGSIPLDLAAVIESGELSPNTPLDLRVRLPRSDTAFISTLVPDIRRSPGTAEADIRVSGTMETPRMQGQLRADLSALRFVDPSLPPVNSLEVRIGFTDTRVSIDRLVGMVGGGSVQAYGNVDLANTENPTLNLQVGSNNALLLQNDDMTARVSSNVTLRGPLDAVRVAGDVWITRARFFRNIDILPIGLPGRPAPQPPAEPLVISFPDPPLRDWTFDVAIRTADPFLVQSNLADGRIFIDLRLAGTGLRPWLEGTINIEQLRASLPFSALDIEDGQIFFLQQDPFIPQLNLQGTSTIREYDVAVTITGSAFAPEALFTSNPPLPQAEVVTLIATGMTTEELTRDPNAIAGRAAILVFQRLYNSIFRRNRPPVQDDSLLSRIQFEVGTVDPKTGNQATRIGIPLTRQLTLVGGVDVGGNFRGQVKYLIRFR